jgi:hypothetical protein
LSERWPVVGDGGWYSGPETAGDVVGPLATLKEVNWIGVTVLVVLVVGDWFVAVARPYLPAVSQPPDGEADWYVVYGA